MPKLRMLVSRDFVGHGLLVAGQEITVSTEVADAWVANSWASRTSAARRKTSLVDAAEPGTAENGDNTATGME